MVSAQFLTGKSIKQALTNLGLYDQYRDSLSELGFDLESICDNVEEDLCRGICSRCRQAACMFDATADYGLPAMAYTLRFEHGAPEQNVMPVD